MINIKDYNIISDNIVTLKEASKDKHGDNVYYMTESSLDVVDFDAVKTQYTNEIGLSEEKASSFDALSYKFDALSYKLDDMCFIEFKNGNMKNEKASVKNKIRDSLLIFCDISNCNISYTRKNINFILVYNGDKNPLPNQITKKLQQESASRTGIGIYFTEKAKQEFILFDLERFKGLYFKEVYTYTVDQFEIYISRLSQIVH